MAQLLTDCGVDYCLIGGLAVVVHGYVRATKDIDFFIDGLYDRERLLEKSATLGLKLHEKDRELAEEGLLFLRPQTKLGFQVDLLSIESSFEQKLVSRAETHVMEQGSIKVITLEDLIALKLSVGRPQDDADAEALIDLRKEELDMHKLQAAASALNADSKLAIFLDEIDS